MYNIVALIPFGVAAALICGIAIPSLVLLITSVVCLCVLVSGCVKDDRKAIDACTLPITIVAIACTVNVIGRFLSNADISIDEALAAFGSILAVFSIIGYYRMIKK